MRRSIFAGLILSITAIVFVAWNSTSLATSTGQRTLSPSVNSYNAVNEFALTQGGTTGIWAYGYTPAATDNTFTPMDAPSTITDCGPPLDVWRRNPGPVHYNPVIARNPGATFSGCGVDRFPSDT